MLRPKTINNNLGIATHLQEQESFSVIQLPNLENPNDFTPWHHAREFLRTVSPCTIEIKRTHKTTDDNRTETLHGNAGLPLVHSAYLRGSAKHLVIAWTDASVGGVGWSNIVISNWFGPPTIEIQCHKEKKVEYIHAVRAELFFLWKISQLS